MIPIVEKLQTYKVERQMPFVLEQEEHATVKKNRELVERRQKYLDEVYALRLRVEGADPKGWELLIFKLRELYGANVAANEISPMTLLSAKSKSSGVVDAQYYGLCKAYTSGQIEILEALFGAFKIDPRHQSQIDLRRPIKRLLDSFIVWLLDKL